MVVQACLLVTLYETVQVQSTAGATHLIDPILHKCLASHHQIKTIISESPLPALFTLTKASASVVTNKNGKTTHSPRSHCYVQRKNCMDFRNTASLVKRNGRDTVTYRTLAAHQTGLYGPRFVGRPLFCKRIEKITQMVVGNNINFWKNAVN